MMRFAAALRLAAMVRSRPDLIAERRREGCTEPSRDGLTAPYGNRTIKLSASRSI